MWRVLPFVLLLSMTSCVCPDVGQLGEMPGFDLATPEHSFLYLKEAFQRGEQIEAYGDQEYACLAERLRRERGLGRGEYYFVRSEIRQLLKDKLGDLDSLKIVGDARYLAPDVAELDIQAGEKLATVVLIRENSADVTLRDRREASFNSPRSPADAIAIRDRYATAVVDVSELVRERGTFGPDDVYELRYRSCWRFYDLKGTQIGADIGRELEQKRAAARAAESRPPQS